MRAVELGEVRAVDVGSYTIPTDGPESDGTLEWSETTVVVVQCTAGGHRGLGYTYGNAGVATIVRTVLAELVCGRPVGRPAETWAAMTAAIRNLGRPGAGMMAVSAVDLALWDLKARTLELPLVELLPAFRDSVPVYGSGGFTSYPNERLEAQLRGWTEAGFGRVKMKIGRDPAADPLRLDTARKAIGDDVELFVDANGAYQPRQAIGWAGRLAHEWDVRWFEEPVSSEDSRGLARVRAAAPGGLDVAAGEYAAVLSDFQRLIDDGAVDCLQADVTRCGGVTGLLQAASLAAGHGLDLSGHCAPAVSAHVLCGVPRLRHLEYFHDHVRIERLLFDGVLSPTAGSIRVEATRPGLGLELREADADDYRTG